MKNQYKQHKIKKIPKTINPETTKPFASLGEYQDYAARQRINPRTGKHFASFTEYQSYIIKKRINPGTKKPFASTSEYQRYLANKHKTDPRRIKLKEIIEDGLEGVDENYSWLAKQLGILRASVSQYVNFKAIPSPEIQEKIFKIFNLPYRSIDDAVNSDYAVSSQNKKLEGAKLK
ncbi:MAG: helix-turn-helix transcriptional regulator [Candidatus Nanoarchaeia archaeon]|nr:helix-turn-helix transcriptional regulator [Candidatus Nanoarchaeia archaeon]MDD5740531.1 helix-turn-helix transcriptional regulator [Candidatus Nanoarchaeia archaeon]